MAYGAELRSCGADHGVVSNAEDRESYDDSYRNIDGRLYELSPGKFCSPRNVFQFAHNPSKVRHVQRFINWEELFSGKVDFPLV